MIGNLEYPEFFEGDRLTQILFLNFTFYRALYVFNYVNKCPNKL